MRLTEFDAQLDGLTYPTSTDDVVSQFGTSEIAFQDGTERLDQVLGRFGTETFDSSDELRMTLYGALPGEAVGRRGYSDRDPPGVDEIEPVSF